MPRGAQQYRLLQWQYGYGITRQISDDCTVVIVVVQFCTVTVLRADRRRRLLQLLQAAAARGADPGALYCILYTLYVMV